MQYYNTTLFSNTQESRSGFYSLVEGLLEDIFKFASLVPRVAKHHAQPDYLLDMDEIAELSDMRDEILSRVSAAITSVSHTSHGHLSPIP